MTADKGYQKLWEVLPDEEGYNSCNVVSSRSSGVSMDQSWQRSHPLPLNNSFMVPAVTPSIIEFTLFSRSRRRRLKCRRHRRKLKRRRCMTLGRLLEFPDRCRMNQKTNKRRPMKRAVISRTFKLARWVPFPLYIFKFHRFFFLRFPSCNKDSDQKGMTRNWRFGFTPKLLEKVS